MNDNALCSSLGQCFLKKSSSITLCSGDVWRNGVGQARSLSVEKEQEVILLASWAWLRVNRS